MFKVKQLVSGRAVVIPGGLTPGTQPFRAEGSSQGSGNLRQGCGVCLTEPRGPTGERA